MRARLACLSLLLPSLAACAGGGGYSNDDGGRDDDAAAAQRERDTERAAGPEEALGKQAESKGKLREALEHYVAAIQALSEGNATKKDLALREKTIKLFLSLDPGPAVPEDVQKIFFRAEAMAKQAKDETAWSRAVGEFEKGLRYAPWDAKGNYNAGLLYELLKKYDPAVRYLNLYLQAAPDAQDRTEVQRKVAALEVKRRSSGPEALVGRWKLEAYAIKHWGESGDPRNWAREWGNPKNPTGSLVSYPSRHYEIEMQGKDIVAFFVLDDDQYFYFKTRTKGDRLLAYKLRLNGRKLSGDFVQWVPATGNAKVDGIVNEEWNEIKISNLYDRELPCWTTEHWVRSE